MQYLQRRKQACVVQITPISDSGNVGWSGVLVAIDCDAVLTVIAADESSD